MLAAWKAAGREGEPLTMALAYYSLGEDAEANVRNVKHYYQWLGEYADGVAKSVATDEATVKGYIEAFSNAGCGELVLFPASSDPDQVDLLADAAL